jgi:hypothetical protein
MMSVEAAGPATDGCEVRLGEFTLRACSGETSIRGDANVVVRPERVEVRPHQADRAENCLPGLVAETVYVGSSLQLMVRLATGSVVQATLSNTGDAPEHRQGDPVLVHLHPEALRVLAGDPSGTANTVTSENPTGAGTEAAS